MVRRWDMGEGRLFDIPRSLFGKLYELNEPSEPNEPLPREVILVVILLWGNELYEPNKLYELSLSVSICGSDLCCVHPWFEVHICVNQWFGAENPVQ